MTPVFSFNCQVCNKPGRAWRQEDAPPKYCSRECTSRGLSGRSLKPVKHVITSAIAEHIRKVYQDMTGNGEVKALAQKYNLPRWKIQRYAQRQGWLAKQPKEPDWSEAEIAILERYAHLIPERIQVHLKRFGFSRSLTGIVLKRKRMNFLANLDGQSAHSLALCFGVDGKTIARWIDKGWLKACKRGTARIEAQGGDMWFIKDLWIRNFITTYPGEVDLRKVDKLWFIEILTSSSKGHAQWGSAA